MNSRLAAFGAVIVAAAVTLAPSAPGAIGDVRIQVISVTPRPPQAGQTVELLARVEFSPGPGSIHATVWVGGKRFRNIRLTWADSVARCWFRVPDGARGKRLTIGLTAALGPSRSRTTLGFRVS